MLRKICAFILKITGWRAIGTVVTDPKCVLVGVPHTSAWDFVISWIFYTSLGGKANVLIKQEFFFWPLGFFLRKMGGIPIDRSRGANVILQTIQQFHERDHMHLAITPEGTRRRTKNWKAGFHTIAHKAGVPVYLSSFDWGRKKVTIWGTFELSDDPQADIRRMKMFFREKGVQGKHPENFTTEF